MGDCVGSAVMGVLRGFNVGEIVCGMMGRRGIRGRGFEGVVMGR